MDRELLYREKMKQLFGDADSSLFTADPEFAEILNKFVFGEVYNHGKLTDKERILITLCALTAGGIFKNFKRYIKAGLNTGLSPEDIKEALYQCAPYTGFPKAIKAVDKANKVFKKYGIDFFKKEIIHVFENEDDMNLKERELVTEEFCNREDTYNLCVGGKGGFSYINKNGMNTVNNKQKSPFGKEFYQKYRFKF